jgi:hypothetical protein
MIGLLIDRDVASSGNERFRKEEGLATFIFCVQVEGTFNFLGRMWLICASIAFIGVTEVRIHFKFKEI